MPAIYTNRMAQIVSDPESPNLPSISDQIASTLTVKQIKRRRGRLRFMKDLDSLRCSVCGDKPTGYHYDALSCNGCKTFFRRAIAQKRKYICSRDGKCELTKEFRCCCRSCRLVKCIKAGMNPKTIQFNYKVKEEEESDDNYGEMSTVPATMHSEDLECIRILDEIVQREVSIESIRSHNSLLVEYRDYPLEELLAKKCVIGSNNLSKKELEPCGAFNTKKMKFWVVSDLFLVVEFAKTFSEFRAMNQNDQIELICAVGGAIQVLSQAFYSFQLKSESFLFPDGTNALYEQIVVCKKTEYENYYRECYCKPVDIIRQIMMSTQEFAMLKALALFSLEGELGQEAQEVVRGKREQLLKVFRKYLINEYGLCHGLEKLAACLVCIATFVEIVEKKRLHLFAVDLMKKDKFPRLVRDIYLKQIGQFREE